MDHFHVITKNQQHKIRLSAIDTPEKAQPWGQKAKESLSNMVFNRQVTVDWHKTDRYGRTLGKVIVDGVDANLGQIKAGMAWHYKQYAKEQPEDDRVLYGEAENVARMLKKGLCGQIMTQCPLGIGARANNEKDCVACTPAHHCICRFAFLMATQVYAADPACEAKAAEKKLAGAAKNSFVKKCVKDAATAPTT